MVVNQLSVAEEFHKYRRMAHELAWKLSQQAGSRVSRQGRAGGPVQQLQDEADTILISLIMGSEPGWPKYDPTRSSRTTYLYQMLRWKLYDYIQAENKRAGQPLATLPKTAELVDVRDDKRICEIVLDLPEGLREIVLIILQEPERFQCRRGVTRYVSTPVYRYLRQMGRSHQEALETQMQLEEYLV